MFHSDMDGIIQIAVDAAKLIRELSEPVIRGGTNLRYQYSPESFMGTEMDNAVLICQRVLEELGATPENKVILNLPSTLFCRRDRVLHRAFAFQRLCHYLPAPPQ